MIQGARGWCTGMTQRDGMGREVGGGFRMGNIYALLLLLLQLLSGSVEADPVPRHRWQPTRLPLPWDSPGKNTGVSCHFLLQCMKVKSESEVTQSCPTPSDPMDCSPRGLPLSMGFSRQEYWSGVPLPHLPSHTIPLGHPSAAAPGILYPALNLDWRLDRKSTRLNSSHTLASRMPSSA